MAVVSAQSSYCFNSLTDCQDNFNIRNLLSSTASKYNAFAVEHNYEIVPELSL